MIINVQPNTEEWYALRPKYIGASEVAALFGHSPYLTKFELWHQKRGNIEDSFQENERVFWGSVLEPAIARGAAETHGWKLDKPAGYYVHDSVEGMGATPDYIITDKEKGEGLLEIKSIDWIVFKDSWDEGEPPIHYLLQLQHQLACTGHKWGAIAALVGGNQLEIFTYDRHEATISKIEQAVKEFWGSVREGQEPPAVAEDYSLLQEMFTHASHKQEDLTADNELPGLCAQYKEAGQRRKEAEKEEKGAKSRIMQKLRDADSAICVGFFIKAPTITRHMKAADARIDTFRKLTVKEEHSQ